MRVCVSGIPPSGGSGGRDFLGRIAVAKRQAARARFGPPVWAAVDEGTPRAASGAPPTPFMEALRRGPGVIAEIKRRSPSRGELRPGLDVAALARAYRDAGASAVSVLTEGEHFGGSLEDLAVAREASGLPVLRKDFLVHPAEVRESREAGADALLLIVRILEDRELRSLLADTLAQGMEALVEVHDEAELARALAAGARVVGVNNRDLQTLRTDLAIGSRLLTRIGAGRVAVVESGLRRGGEVRRFRSEGARGFLIGESLMLAQDPGAKLREFVEAAREAEQ
jgi:indole-3-glycerol phosphate synthase